MPGNESEIEQATHDYRQLIETARTLYFGILFDDGTPGCGTAPFVQVDQVFHVFVSQLAPHTRQLLKASRSQVLVVEDEQSTKQIFARKRASFSCAVSVIPSDSKARTVILSSMENRFGGVVSLLQDLPDFVLFALRPTWGRFVSGFAQAYDISGKGLDILRPVQPGT